MPEVIPLNERELRIAINKMILSFPAAERTRAARIEVYAEALSRIPLVFVQEACQYAANGRLNGGKWLPNAGEVRQLAETLQQKALQGQKPSTRMVPIAWPTRISETFDPTARKFSPWRLAMTKEEIIAKVVEARRAP